MAALDNLLDRSFETTAGSKTLRNLLEGDLPTVFVSYPKDFTLVCTRQLCNYRDQWELLAPLRCQWWGINQEPIAKHERFKSEKGLAFDLVSDPDAALLKPLGLKSALWTRRGFALVSPSGEILNSTAGSPMTYRRADEVKSFLEPLLKGPA